MQIGVIPARHVRLKEGLRGAPRRRRSAASTTARGWGRSSPKSGRLPEATLAARTHDFVAALITRAAALITERPLVELCGLPTEQSDMEPLNSQPSMEQAKRQAASAGSSQPSMERQQTKGPPNTIAAPVAPEALPTPAAPRRVPTKAAATRPARDIQGSMDSARAQQATTSAASAGFASALPWGLASTAAVAAGSKFSPAFAKATSPSARVALAISPPLFAFFLAGDLRVHREAKSRGDDAVQTSGATWPLQLANAFYNHTLIAFGMVITPMYGAILHSELSKPRYEGWRLSHAVIHTRVYGQAAAVGSLVLVFGFKDILRQSGAPFKVD